MKKDKEKVIDEVWTEDHVRSYLSVRGHDGSSDDFHMLHKAYQSMRPEDFELFLSFFLAEGRDVNARSLDDRTVLDIVSEHRHGAPFAEALRAAGAS